jgi:SAM-dependent methyltransferase
MLDTLTRDRYQIAYEPGCSIGEFTALLATRCERVFASDLSGTAVAAARRRCGACPNVTVTVGALPADLPEGYFDLIIFSEIGYYFSAGELRRVASLLHERLLPQGELMAVHWLGRSVDHILHGDEVGRILTQVLGERAGQRRIENGFRVDLWRRP